MGILKKGGNFMTNQLHLTKQGMCMRVRLRMVGKTRDFIRLTEIKPIIISKKIPTLLFIDLNIMYPN